MKTKSFVTLFLLLALTFSVMHEYVFAFYDTKPCNVSEYVSELDVPSSHGDICDIHFEYHQLYLFSSSAISIQKVDKTSEIQLKKDSYTQKTTQDFIIPPIV